MNSLQIYLQTIQKIYQTQKATEHSYRPALQEFIQSFGDKLTVTNEPFQQILILANFVNAYVQTICSGLLAVWNMLLKCVDTRVFIIRQITDIITYFRKQLKQYIRFYVKI
jgi:hypothetical protein